MILIMPFQCKCQAVRNRQVCLVMSAAATAASTPPSKSSNDISDSPWCGGTDGYLLLAVLSTIATPSPSFPIQRRLQESSWPAGTDTFPQFTHLKKWTTTSKCVETRDDTGGLDISKSSKSDHYSTDYVAFYGLKISRFGGWWWFWLSFLTPS